MRLFLAPLIANREITPGVHLLEVREEQLAQNVQPGQFCMLRCCDPQASDPFLRRPLFVHEVDREHGLTRFLVYVRGRATAWLIRQSAGIELDIQGPLGHAWTIRPETRNLLLLGEAPVLSAVISLVHSALEQELAVTLVCAVSQGSQSYPAALLPPEVEYQVFSNRPDELAAQLKGYLTWADAACCSVSHETLQALIWADSRWQERRFAQIALWDPLACGSGVCLACQIETQHGPQFICRDGPVFPLTELLIEK